MKGMFGRISGFEGSQFFLNVPGQILENIVELPSHFNHTLPHPENHLNARQVDVHFLNKNLGKPESFEVLGGEQLSRGVLAADGTNNIFLLQFTEKTLSDLEVLDNFSYRPEFSGHRLNSPLSDSPDTLKRIVNRECYPWTKV